MKKRTPARFTTCTWVRLPTVTLATLALTAAGAAYANNTAYADIAPDGLPRYDLMFGSPYVFAQAFGPTHIRGGARAFTEVDETAGTIKTYARTVNKQNGSASGELVGSFIVSPLPGVISTGPVLSRLILRFEGDFELGVETGDALTATSLATIDHIRLDHMASAGSNVVLSRARVIKTYREVTAPLSPSVDGPRVNVFANTVEDTLGDGLITLGVDSDKKFRGSLSIPIIAPVGQAVAFEAFMSTNVTSGTGYTSFADFSHTASLSIDLPTGYAFTSGSGLLLTAPVPEPAAWLQMLAGLGLTGTLVSRMRRKSPNNSRNAHRLAAS